MSNFGGEKSLSNRLKKIHFSDDGNKPDFRELDIGSPVSPLRTRSSGPAQSSLTTTTTTTTTSSGSSSTGSFRVNPKPVSHSGELEKSPNLTAGRTRPGHTRSGSMGSHPVVVNSGGGSVNSPPLNVLPKGNIMTRAGSCSGQLPARKTTRTDVLGSGGVNYGHGSIMWAGGAGSSPAPKLTSPSGPIPVAPKLTSPSGPTSGGYVSLGGGSSRGVRGSVAVGNIRGNVVDPEELKRVGNEEYKNGNFGEALRLYDRAIAIAPGNAAYRSNRAAALTGLCRLGEAVMECEEAIRLDPGYGRAHQRLGSLLIRLGQVEVARKHLCYAGQQPEATELLKLQAVEKHLTRCYDSRIMGDWKSALREADAAVAAGADYSPQLFLCRAESLLQLQQLDDIESILLNIPKIDPFPHCCSNSKSFGMLLEAYLIYVRAQLEMALGRFENAVTSAEKARKIDPRNVEISTLLNTVRKVARARDRGNELFKSERLTEACSAYGEGLKIDPSNSVLYGNRAACWYKLGMWEKSIEDCNHALRIHPNYTKALLRRAATNNKLERWAEAVRDYLALRKKLPQDNEVDEALFHAQVALKKSRGKACQHEVRSDV